MAGAPAPASGPRQSRRGPAPFASFDHDVSDESSPESKQTFQLPEIVEDPAASPGGLAPPEQRARSHSSPAVAGALGATPRIDISRASSSSHHDSRDSSPEMALFAGTAEDADRGRLELGFREDGALELRSSTEELAFLEGAPGEPKPAPVTAPPPPTSVSRRHSRKDSQGSEAALLAVSGRTSRLSSVGSQCSAHSALSNFSHASRVSRLSVVSGTSRSPSPHKMLLETSFCGPKPIETDPEICAAAVEERLLELVRAGEPSPAPTPAPAAAPAPVAANTRDRREVRTEVTVESTSARPAAARAAPAPAKPAAEPAVAVAVTPAEEKRQKETRNQVRAARSKEREPEVYKNRNRSKDIIRIKLKPDSEYEDDDDESEHTLVSGACKPATLELAAGRAPSPSPQRRSPSPGGPTSRKSSFCSLFKSRETIASPDSPSGLRRKKSLTEGRSRSKSRDRDRDRSTIPSSAGKLRGSVLSLFKTPRRNGASPSPNSCAGSRASSPGPAAPPPAHVDRPRCSSEKLKYYEDGGIIHIPLRTPPDERPGSSARRPGSEPDARAPAAPEPARPASAPHPPRPDPIPSAPSVKAQKPVHRTVLPDGSIIIPLHSPTERTAPREPEPPAPSAPPEPDSDTVTPDSRQSIASPESRRSVVTPDSRVGTSESRPDGSRNGDLRTSSSDEGRAEAPAEPVTAECRKQRLVFTTHVGSREQVFSTQFSITKTPSVTSEISESLPSFEPSFPEERPPPLRDTHITCAEPGPVAMAMPMPTPTPTPVAMLMPMPTCTPIVKSPSGSDSRRSLGEARSPTRDSSESEGSSEATPARGGSDVEQRGLVVQESFEDELPYVPTTLPLERSLALPMVPVRERGARVATAGTRRPRAPAPPGPRAPAPPPPPPPAAATPPPGEKLRIKLPRRPRTASASDPPRPERSRTRSGGYGPVAEPRAVGWIDFSEVPERRKPAKRIQTLPAAEARDVVFSYVEPEECRCECHARQDDELPLLTGPHDHHRGSEAHSSPEEGCAAAARPFVADFDLRAPDLDPPMVRTPLTCNESVCCSSPEEGCAAAARPFVADFDLRAPDLDPPMVRTPLTCNESVCCSSPEEGCAAAARPFVADFDLRAPDLDPPMVRTPLTCNESVCCSSPEEGCAAAARPFVADFDLRAPDLDPPMVRTPLTCNESVCCSSPEEGCAAAARPFVADFDLRAPDLDPPMEAPRRH